MPSNPANSSYLPVVAKCDSFRLPSGPWTIAHCVLRLKTHAFTLRTAPALTTDEFLVPFFLDFPPAAKSTTPIGFLRPIVVAALKHNPWAESWEALLGSGACVPLNASVRSKEIAAIAFADPFCRPGGPRNRSFKERSKLMANLVGWWRAEHTFPERLKEDGWRGEVSDIYGPIDPARPHASNAIFQVEKTAWPLFTFVWAGSHLTGYIEGQPERMWVARRSWTEWTYAGKLDSVVAGSIDSVLPEKDGGGRDSPLRCMIRECWEEASITEEEISDRLALVSTITHTNKDKWGFIHPCVLYCFTAAFPAGKRPSDHRLLTPRLHKKKEGEDNPAAHLEVDSFMLRTWSSMTPTHLLDEWKPNAACVVVDHALHHELIRPETDPFFLELSTRLRAPIEVTVPAFSNGGGKPMALPVSTSSGGGGALAGTRGRHAGDEDCYDY